MGEYIRKTARYNGRKYEATGKTEIEAMTKLAEKLAAAKRGEETIGGSMTVNAWYAEWKRTYKDPKGLTKKSLGMYDEKYNGYIRPAIGHMKLKDVKDVHLQRILNGQAGKSRSHVEKIRRVLREMFSRARKSRLIAYDPAEDLELPDHTEKGHRSLTDQERTILLQVCRKNDFGLWFALLLYTGMRPGEAAVLNWRDIDFNEGMIHIHSALESGSSNIKPPKTTAGNRDIPIHAELLPWLMAGKGKPFSPVFPTGTGGRQNSGSMARLWRACKRAMNIEAGAEVYRNRVQEDLFPDLTPYCLRHTFATDCARAGVPLETTRWLLGHADISTTANIYQHRDLETLKSGMAILDGSAVEKDAPGGKSGGNVKNKISNA